MRHVRAVFALIFLFVLAVLAGCATPLLPVSESAPAESASTLSRSGRFAMKSEVFGKQPQAVQGGFVWLDRGRLLTLDLTNPMGTVLARVEVGPQGALLQESNGTVTRAAHPDALVRQVLGEEIPVSGLRSWMRGLVAPGFSAEDLSRNDGRIARFRQSGWMIELSRYDEQGPRLLVMTRQDGERAVTLRLVVDQN